MDEPTIQREVGHDVIHFSLPGLRMSTSIHVLPDDGELRMEVDITTPLVMLNADEIKQIKRLIDRTLEEIETKEREGVSDALRR